LKSTCYSTGNIERVVGRSTYWVDITKRIPLKIETYEGEILTRSMELSNIKNLN